LISLGLDMPPLSPLTLREAKVRAFSVIGKLVAGSRLPDRSRDSNTVARRGLLGLALLLVTGACWHWAIFLRNHQLC
jgi:hypothetical protein